MIVGRLISALGGGIRSAKQALAYLVMLKETLGDDWLTPDLFRFGASTLVNDVLMQIVNSVDGNCQGPGLFFAAVKRSKRDPTF